MAESSRKLSHNAQLQVKAGNGYPGTWIFAFQLWVEDFNFTAIALRTVWDLFRSVGRGLVGYNLGFGLLRCL